jgi:hypothetical protein
VVDQLWVKAARLQLMQRFLAGEHFFDRGRCLDGDGEQACHHSEKGFAFCDGTHTLRKANAPPFRLPRHRPDLLAIADFVSGLKE